MKFCHELEAIWQLPCGYPRQWLDTGGALVDDAAPVGTLVIFAKREDGRVAYSLVPHEDYNPLTHRPAQQLAEHLAKLGADGIYLDYDQPGRDWYTDPVWAPLNK